MKNGTHFDRFLLAFVFALMFHFILVQMLISGIKEEVDMNGTVVEVEYLNPLATNEYDKGSVEKHLSPRKKEDITEDIKNEEEKEIIEVKKEVEEKWQVVYIGETESNKKPEKYRFLAEHNSSVEKETVSKYARNDYKNPAPRPQIGKNSLSNFKDNESRGKKPAPGIVIKENRKDSEELNENEKEKRLALKIPKLLKSDSVKMEESENGVRKNADFSEEINGEDDQFQFGTTLEKGKELHKRRLAQLFPEDVFSGKYSGGPFNDWLKDVEESDATFLNAKEYKYASFFNRIKKTVSQYWDPSNVILKYDPYGNIYGNKDRLTIVKVRIDSGGNLKEIDVSQSSGIDFLDKVAVDAFRAAQPFPNPPKGLMDKEGNITFNFGFYVEFSRSSLRLFKYE